MNDFESLKKQEKLLNTYFEERECNYKDRHYRVRDNGSAMRLPKDPTNPRKGDNEWTFGTFNKSNGYPFIGSHQVHRIVATAFHGNPGLGTDIVDHIDTDRQNNRPENLRWTTKLQNVLNPATRKKLELMTGMPIEEILKDMSIKGLQPSKRVSMAGCGIERRIATYTPEHASVGGQTLQETRYAI